LPVQNLYLPWGPPGLHVYQNFGAEAYRKYHNNLMAVAHTFMTSQRKFELSDFNTVVEKSGFNSTFSDREKNRYENVISGNMQLGEALGITGTPGFHHYEYEKAECGDYHI
jgi:hypothetical protein